MKLGVLTVPLYDRSYDEAFAFLAARGVETVEIGTGGYPGKGHCDPAVLLADEGKLNAFRDSLKKHNLEICALSTHSNHVSPNAEVRRIAAEDFTLTCRLAEKLGVDTVVTFSGCPGDCEESQRPNWVTIAWPSEYGEVLRWQWEEKVIPFWKEAAKEAANYGVTKIALEMHPGFCVYNPATVLKLRDAVGNAIGANVDPSHLYWQGIDPVAAINALKGAIYHFHVKDTKINPYTSAVNGVLDTQSFTALENRSWLFRTAGYGHDELAWKNIMTALRLAGYNGSVSIEHEDAFMSVEEGLEKGIKFLAEVIIRDSGVEAWWA